MIIIASKLFASEVPHAILHMPKPCANSLRALFHETPTMDWIVVTDCVAPLFEEDLVRIEKERDVASAHTHVKGTFVVHRSLGCLRRQTAPTWEQIFE
jgi:hypothetical protein